MGHDQLSVFKQFGLVLHLDLPKNCLSDKDVPAELNLDNKPTGSFLPYDIEISKYPIIRCDGVHKDFEGNSAVGTTYHPLLSVPGYITYVVPQHNVCVLSGPINSDDTYIVSWVDEGGSRRVGQIGTILSASTEVASTEDEKTNKRLKENFIESISDNCTGFAPHTAWPVDEIEDIHERFSNPERIDLKIVGLVNPTDEVKFYSVLLFYMKGEKQKCIVGGMKKADALDYGELAQKLRSK
mmetsp:Transcript_1273/g.1476  ORF Transcript_1273/g.1476 Transcript_1273/m.1476 type:complete len:240 (+) Transcript_1273:179-898(+)